MRDYPGLSSVVEMLATLSETEQEQLLRQLTQKDQELVKKIRAELFTSKDFVYIPAVELVKALKAFSREDVMLALKVVPKDTFKHLLSGMSERQRKDFQEDFESQGRHPLKKAQKMENEVVAYIKILIDTGRISFKKPGVGEDWVD